MEAVSPAPAGMIPAVDGIALVVHCEPRTRGDDPAVYVIIMVYLP